MTYKILTILVMLCMSGFCQKKRADTINYGDSDIQWRMYDTQGPVSAFTVTSNMVLWFATSAGVGKYDLKANTKNVYQKFGDFFATSVKAIAEDASTLYCGTDNGIIVWKAEKATKITKKDGICDDKITALAAKDGIVWVGSNSGASRYASGTWTNYGVEQGLASAEVRAIVIDNNGNAWFSSGNGISVFSNGQWTKHTKSNGLSHDDVRALGYDNRKNEIWVAVGEQDVNCFNGKEWLTFMDIFSGITCIMGDTQSRIWFGSSNGLIKYNGFEWVSDPNKLGFTATQVFCMTRDKKGDLYFGLDKGILHMKNPYPF